MLHGDPWSPAAHWRGSRCADRTAGAGALDRRHDEGSGSTRCRGAWRYGHARSEAPAHTPLTIVQCNCHIAGGYDAIFAILVSEEGAEQGASRNIERVERVWADWSEMTVQALLVHHSPDGLGALVHAT